MIFRFIIASCFLLNLQINLRAADTLRIHLTYKHLLNDAGQTTGYKTLKQQFFTPEGIFFREINYSESTGQIASYIFNFYKNGRLATEECYKANDSLDFIMLHEYDDRGNETAVSKLVPGKDQKLIAAEKSVFRYNSNQKVASTKKFYMGKTGETAVYTYNSAGNLIRRKISYKQSANADVNQEVRVYSYSADNNLRLIMVSGKDKSGKTFQYKEEYSYENNLLKSVKRFGTDGTLNSEKVYKYLDSGAPSLYEERDSAGKLNLLLQYDYKKHFMEIGTQKSYYENL